jgi:dye decolorizing peroxidase
MPHQVSRRRVLAGAGALGALAACSPAPAATAPPRVDPHGATQAGIARPAPAQQYCDLSIWDTTAATLETLSQRITALTNGDPAMAGLDTGTLSITVGLGPNAVRAIDPTLPGTTDLPTFPGDHLEHQGGDLLLQVCADDPIVASLATADLARTPGITLKWRQNAFRGPTRPDGASRNLLGFVDGIVVPHGEQELAKEVWLDHPRGATIAVVRRMRLDVAKFLERPTAEQEQIFGRRRDTAEPLSGGGPDAVVDLAAKTEDGQYLIPTDAHVRRAHPLTSGSGLMLRRSYSYDNGPSDRGLLFISFQQDLRTFVATQHRLAEGDALMRFATTTASGTFLILPGFTRDRPLGLSH